MELYYKINYINNEMEVGWNPTLFQFLQNKNKNRSCFEYNKFNLDLKFPLCYVRLATFLFYKKSSIIVYGCYVWYLPGSEAVCALDMLGIAGGVARRVEPAVGGGEVAGEELMVAQRSRQLLAVVLEHPCGQMW